MIKKFPLCRHSSESTQQFSALPAFRAAYTLSIICGMAVLAGCHYHGERVLIQNQWRDPIEFQWIDTERNVLWSVPVDAHSSIVSLRPGVAMGGATEYANLNWNGPAATIRVISAGEVLFEREFANFDCVGSDGSLIGRYGRWDWEKGYLRFVVTQRDVVYVLDDIEPPMREPVYKSLSEE